MLDILLSRLKEEIAIDGFTGSSIETVWEYVEAITKDIADDLGAQITPLIDDRYKSFIWNYLKLEKELEFYENIADIGQIDSLESNSNELNNADPTEQENLMDTSEDVTTEPTASKKRKQPPKAKKKAPAKKKAKPKTKKKPSRKAAAVNSDDDFDANIESEESSEESDFEEDISEEDDELDSEEYDSDVEKMMKAHNKKKPKETKQKSKKTTVKPTLRRLDDISNLTYEEAKEKFGSRLYITASYELQQIQLYTNVPPGSNLSSNVVIILQEIIKTRQKGLLQAHITKLLGIDSRSTGHYCKVLEQKGAIVRNGVSTNKMRTNICIHTRFTAKNQLIDITDQELESIPYNVNTKGEAFSQATLRDRLLELVSDSPNKAMLSEDVLRALAFDNSRKSVKKWFNRTIDELCVKGFLRKSNFRNNNKGRIQRCLHLVKLPEKKKEVNEIKLDNVTFPIKVDSLRKEISIIPVLIDIALDSQVLQVLKASGTTGATQKEIGFALNTDEGRILYKILDKLCELTGIGLLRYGASRLLEFEGRQRRYRYFTYVNFKKVHENLDIDVPPLPEPEMDESKFSETNYLIDPCRSSKKFRKHVNKNNVAIVNARGIERPRPKGRSKKPNVVGDGNSLAISKNTRNSTSNTALPPATTSLSSNNADTAPIEAVVPTIENVDTSNDASNTTKRRVEEEIPESSKKLRIDENTTTESITPSTEAFNIDPIRPVIVEIESCEPIEQTAGSTTDTIMETPSSSSSTVGTSNNDKPVKPVRLFDIFTNSRKSSAKFTRASPAATAKSTKKAEPIESVNATEATKPSEVVIPVTTTEPSENVLPTKATRRIKSPAVNKKKDATAETNNTPIETSTSTNVAADSIAKETVNPPEPISIEKNTPGPSEKPAPRYFGIFTRARKVTTNENEQGIENVAPAEASTKTSDVTVNATPDVDTSVIPLEEAVNVSESAADSENAAPADGDAVVSSVDNVHDAAEPSTVVSNEKTTDVSMASPMDVDQTKSTPSYYNPFKRLSKESSSLTQGTFIDTRESPTPGVLFQGPNKPALVFKKGPSHKITNTVKQVNIYLEARVKVLVSLLEDQPMWEMDKILMEAYVKKAEALHGPVKYAVCPKTLWRTANHLAKKGLAQIDVLVCPLWNGDTVERKILMRKDIDMNGLAYIEYKKRTTDRRATQMNRAKLVSLDKAPAHIERLEDRIMRLREDLRELEVAEKYVEAKLLRERIDELSGNAQKFKRTGDFKPEKWLISRVQFGWIHARMLRVKELHLYLCGFINSEETLPGVNKEKRTIDTVTIVSNMTLGFLCQVIGILRPEGFVVDFIRNRKNMTLRFADLPHNIKGELFSDKNAFRRKLRSLIAALEYFELVTPNIPGYVREEDSIYMNLAASYHVCSKSVVKDRKKRGQPILREYSLDNAYDLDLFWNDFQYACTKGDTLPPEEQEPKPENPWIAELWCGMHHSPTWSTASVFSREQRKILNSYIDTENSKTPIENATLCNEISKESNVPFHIVRRYYDKVEAALSQKNKNRELKEYRKKCYVARPSRKKHDPSGGRRVINLSSTRAFKQIPNKYINSYEVRATTETNENTASKNNMEETPIFTHPAALLCPRRERTRRSVWSSHEDDLLLYGYAIARQRAAGSPVRWFPINSMFPHKPVNASRHRLGRLVSDPKYAEQLENATNQWAKFYVEGLRNGDIEDPNPSEVVNYDLLSFLAYFIKRLSEDEPIIESNILPKDIKEMKKRFNVSHNHSDVNIHFIEDAFAAKKSLISQMTVLYDQSFSARRLKDVMFDNPESALIEENDIRRRQIRILIAFSLMCLLTPTEIFNPFYSYSIICNYPEKAFNEAVGIMRAHGTLIVAKQERPIPGTKFSLSAKFSSLMCGELPEDFFVHAKKFDEFLNEQSDKMRFYPEYANSGMIACIFDYLSKNELDITMANRQTRLRLIENRKLASRAIDRSAGYFELDVEKKQKTLPVFPNENLDDRVLKDLDIIEFNDEVNRFLETQDDRTKKLCKRIIDLLLSKKDVGLSLYQLKLELQRGEEEYDDDSIKRAANSLEYNNPALIVTVGFNAARIVTATNLKTWFIFTKDASLSSQKAKVVLDDEMLSNDSMDNVDRKEVIAPNLWTDINGNTTELVLRECKAAVIEYILRRPGTSDANIYRKFEAAFDKRGVRNVLDILVKQNVVKQVQVHHSLDLKARKSIFSKPCSFKCSNDIVIYNATQTFYWLQPHYYHIVA